MQTTMTSAKAKIVEIPTLNEHILTDPSNTNKHQMKYLAKEVQLSGSQSLGKVENLQESVLLANQSHDKFCVPFFLF